MPRLSEAYLYRSYYVERGLSDPPRYSYGRKKTKIAASSAITQQEGYPSLGQKKVSLVSGDISLTQIDFANAKTLIDSSRKIATTTTTSLIRTGGKDDVIRAGWEIQFWQGTQVYTGAGSDSILINNSGPIAREYLGNVMLVGGLLSMGEGSDSIDIIAHNRGNLSQTNDPGLDISQQSSSTGRLDMGTGDDRIFIDSYFSASLRVGGNCQLLMGEGNDSIDLLTGGMNIQGAIYMGDGNDRFSIGSLAAGRLASVQRGSYALDPIIDGGSGIDLMALPDGFYTVSTDIEGTRIMNDSSPGWPGSIDITLSSFEEVTGSIANSSGIPLVNGSLQITNGVAQYT